MDVLVDYPWPGNVRQLEHAIEHAFIHCTGRTIHIRHLPEDIKQEPSALVEKVLRTENPIQEVEKETILEALKRNHWNRDKTARVLHISRITLWRKMKKFGIE
jgi:transcriptional regulator of acetoin/glycerol metabolism